MAKSKKRSQKARKNSPRPSKRRRTQGRDVPEADNEPSPRRDSRAATVEDVTEDEEEAPSVISVRSASPVEEDAEAEMSELLLRKSDGFE